MLMSTARNDNNTRVVAVFLLSSKYNDIVTSDQTHAYNNQGWREHVGAAGHPRAPGRPPAARGYPALIKRVAAEAEAKAKGTTCKKGVRTGVKPSWEHKPFVPTAEKPTAWK